VATSTTISTRPYRERKYPVRAAKRAACNQTAWSIWEPIRYAHLAHRTQQLPVMRGLSERENQSLAHILRVPETQQSTPVRDPLCARPSPMKHSADVSIGRGGARIARTGRAAASSAADGSKSLRHACLLNTCGERRDKGGGQDGDAPRRRA